MPRKAVPEDDPIEELQRVARLDEVDGTPVWNDMVEHGEFHPATYYSWFESWLDALDEAGLDPSPKQRSNVTIDELIQDVQRVADDLDVDKDDFEAKMYKEHGKFSYQSCYNKIGTWNETLEAANV